MADEDPRKFRYPMTDNPKSLASLADELDRYAVEIHSLKGGVIYASRLREAAAALRAPTIAADERFQNPRRAKSAAEVSAEFRSDPERNRLYLESQKRLGIEAALSTPSPTIAALEPLQLTESEAAELDAFRAKPSRAEGLTFTPVPTIAAPSPSNEVTVEMVDEFCNTFQPQEGNDNLPLLRDRVRQSIEAALKARKPADEAKENPS